MRLGIFLVLLLTTSFILSQNSALAEMESMRIEGNHAPIDDSFLIIKVIIEGTSSEPFEFFDTTLVINEKDTGVDVGSIPAVLEIGANSFTINLKNFGLEKLDKFHADTTYVVRTQYLDFIAEFEFTPIAKSQETEEPEKTVVIEEPEEDKLVKTTHIPDWIRNNAKWWSEGSIEDSDFLSGIQFMIQNDIIRIPDLPEQTSEAQEHIPDWIRNNAEWWSQGLISDDDFISGIKYLVEQGIISV